MKKLLLLLLCIIVLSISSCKTIDRCPAYGEHHKFMGKHKMKKSSVEQVKPFPWQKK